MNLGGVARQGIRIRAYVFKLPWFLPHQQTIIHRHGMVGDQLHTVGIGQCVEVLDITQPTVWITCLQPGIKARIAGAGV